MQIDSLTITAPALSVAWRREAEVLDSVIWLWMQAREHRDIRLHAVSRLLLPALKHKQFILAWGHDGQQLRPVACMSWANLNSEAESRYLNNPTTALHPDDWNSGDRMWITDWFTPFGHTRKFRRAVEQLLSGRSARTLYRRGNERGVRVLALRGDQVTQAQAKQWWQDRPMVHHGYAK